MSKFNVYRQAEPIPTGEKFTHIDRNTGRTVSGEFCRANLVKVGEAANFAEAKRLCVAPVMERHRQ